MFLKTFIKKHKTLLHLYSMMDVNIIVE